MSIEITPLHTAFAGEVAGIDTTRNLTPAEVVAIEAGMDRCAVLVFRNQRLTDDQQLVFSQAFGELEFTNGTGISKPGEQRLHPAFADVSNLDTDNQILARDNRRRLYSLGNMLWHSDSSFKPVPAKYSILSGRVVATTGGETEFADMRAAHDALDDVTKVEIESLVCEHSLIYSREVMGFGDLTRAERATMRPVRQALVRTHPGSGRKSLYLGSHIGTIICWPIPEARAFIRDLTEHATQRRFVYAHRWRPFDLVMWDNRATMHRVRRYDSGQVRDMRRTTVAGTALTTQQPTEVRAAE
ncbi:MAG TPA: TauD/TfdA family dioxygenase [Acetobacteraceae bacterium]|jgi:alpha-ketoglutarate-dependent 2,4-dichlorophenoxyacetate dioxygenase|nr:TauD/TfdA family dioxygenase [Acetobacteraceae bacterium]